MTLEVLFCPFCGESFEDARTCPEHEIPLVDFAELERVRGATALADDAQVAPWDPRHGRGFVFAGSLTMLAGFFCPFVRADFQGTPIVATGLEVASGNAMNLWVVPALAVTLSSIVMRRRTPAAMRGARLALPALALVAAVSVGYTLYRVNGGANLIEQRFGQGVDITALFGPFVVLGGALLAALGGLRLGTTKDRAPTYRVDG